MSQTETSTIAKTPTYTIEQLALLAADAADDRKAGDAILIDISKVSVLADYLLIVSGYSKVQLRAISDSIIEKLEQEYDRPPIRSEAKNQSGWVLLDYGDLIVHIMTPEQREFYNLEAFWGHGDTVPLPERVAKAPAPAYDLYGNTPEEDEDFTAEELEYLNSDETEGFTAEELEYLNSDDI
jgi:ribosome-associated protein